MEMKEFEIKAKIKGDRVGIMVVKDKTAGTDKLLSVFETIGLLEIIKASQIKKLTEKMNYSNQD